MKKSRAKSIHAGPTIESWIARDRRATLMQWDYIQLGSDKFGGYIKHSFVSLITRPGLPGIWIDKPYHCYSGGPHRYRRVPRLLAARIRIACARGTIEEAASDTLRSAKRRLADLRHVARTALAAINPWEIARRRKAAKEWQELWGE